MRKIWIFTVFLISSLLLIACDVPIVPEVPIGDLDAILDVIPDQLDHHLVLQNRHLGQEVTWYLEDKILENHFYEHQYQEYANEVEISFQVTIDGVVHSRAKTITLMQTMPVSALYITTEGNQEITSKESYIRATANLESDEVFNLQDLSLRIRGRGNSTWHSFPKKPYRLNFDSRTSLLGMAPARNYALIAEYTDKSFLRNYIMHAFSKMLDISYTIETRYVELYLNGSYNGLYLLTEHVNVDSNRLSIDTSNDVDGGFLLELETDDRIEDEGVENVNWFRLNGYNYVVKSPDMDDLPAAVVAGKINYMRNYLDQFEQSILNDTYANYIDLDKFIDYFILQEISKNVDIVYSSVFMYKDKDGKLMMGPVWDFDISLGNGDYYDYHPEGFHATRHPWLSGLLNRYGFKELYINRFKEVLDTYVDDLASMLDHKALDIEDAANRNFNRWPTLEEYVWPNTPGMLEATTYREQVLYVKNYLHARAAWLRENIDYI